MEETKIYIELSDEFQALLADNRMSVADILRNNDIDAKVEYGVIPSESEQGARTKDLVTIILASSASVGVIGYTISRVMHEIFNKPVYVEYDQLEEIRDANGNVLLDKKGNPFMKTVKHHEFIETGKTIKSSQEVSFGPTKGVVIKVGSEEKQRQSGSEEKQKKS